jgi:hypothetical protein
MKDGEIKCVSNSTDCQEVPEKDGFNMTDIMDKYYNSNTILEHFEYYDLRQDNYEKSNPITFETHNQNN